MWTQTYNQTNSLLLNVISKINSGYLFMAGIPSTNRGYYDGLWFGRVDSLGNLISQTVTKRELEVTSGYYGNISVPVDHFDQTHAIKIYDGYVSCSSSNYDKYSEVWLVKISIS
jgi:hypothetical protein